MKDLDKNEQAAYIANLRARSTTMNNSPVLSLDELRGQFQGWIITKGIYSSDFKAYATGEYFQPAVESAWQAWLACAIQNGVVKQ